MVMTQSIPVCALYFTKNFGGNQLDMFNVVSLISYNWEEKNYLSHVNKGLSNIL